MIKPDLSICIPTYNRSKFLLECLQSITSQLNRYNMDKVEVIISDNASQDETEDVVKKFQRRFSNIFYFKNNKNIGIEKNLLKAGTYAKSSYIWFMSDDDLQNKGSIDLIIKTLQNKKPDVVFINLDAFNTLNNKIIGKNLLGIYRSLFVYNRKDLYEFLSYKFPYSVDWITTFYSILIINREILLQSVRLSNIYKTKYDMFPHELGIFYSKKDYKIFFLPNRLVRYREGNSSWKLNNKLDFLRDWDKVLYKHYSQIISINNDVIPMKFKINFLIKNVIRRVRLNYEILFSKFK